MARVGTLAWNSQTLSTGSRDRFILQRDVRAPEAYVTHSFSLFLSLSLSLSLPLCPVVCVLLSLHDLSLSLSPTPGHTLRVLYLAMSPDGQTIVTGAGDETLRFYSVWPQAKGTRRTMSLLDDSNLSNIR
eukprot:TRINITY_DN119_c0_g1_i4.p2 TRINITY_DN119_c0_g1~~TRINITY_DN119_c0_g1_i4.p2  ORF type:complete len:130 (-),score=28.70 TRINITY_DN119_c0_g1_i4:328-717(-)